MKSKIAIGVILILFAACKPVSKVLNNSNVETERQSVLKAFEKNDLLVPFLSANINVSITNKEKVTNLSGSFRFIKDSAIWLSVSPGLGIEVARVLIRKDSIFVLDRIKSIAYSGNLQSIAKLLNFEFTFNDFQSIFLGSYGSNANIVYNSTNLLTADFEQTAESFVFKGKNSPVDKISMREFHISKQLYKAAGYKLAYNDTNLLTINYTDFNKLDQYAIPEMLKIQLLSNAKSSSFEIAYLKPEITEGINVAVKIPTRYTIVSIENLFNNSKTN
ncbi:MAG TPA: hypothetical protein DCQ31_07735 [Bacteroidales bacterium]|nr:hypothetical protein [Bacteroidales bacterium]